MNIIILVIRLLKSAGVGNDVQFYSNIGSLVDPSLNAGLFVMSLTYDFMSFWHCYQHYYTSNALKQNILFVYI